MTDNVPTYLTPTLDLLGSYLDRLPDDGYSDLMVERPEVSSPGMGDEW